MKGVLYYIINIISSDIAKQMGQIIGIVKSIVDST